MIAIGILILLIIGVLFLVGYMLKTKFDDGYLTIIIIVLAVTGFWIQKDYYQHRVVFPNEYKALQTTIQTSLNLLSNQDLTAQSNDMRVRLSILVEKEQDMIFALRISRRNPWILFKPIIFTQQIQQPQEQPVQPTPPEENNNGN